MKKLVLGSLLGALVMFVWGAVFWTSPLPYSVMGKIPDEAAAGKALLEHFPRSGTYLVPSPMQDEKVLTELSRSGPIATVHIQTRGGEPMSAGVFIFGFLHELIAVFLIALLLSLALPGLPTYGRRLGFVALAGLASSIYVNGANPIWWHHPWPFYLVNGVYDFVAWSATGLVLAGMIKPKPASTAGS